MANMKEECEAFLTCFGKITGAVCLFVGICIIVGLMMAVMAIWIPLPLHISKTLWVGKKGRVIEVYFRKFLNCHLHHHNHLGNSLQFLVCPVLILFL